LKLVLFHLKFFVIDLTFNARTTVSICLDVISLLGILLFTSAQRGVHLDRENFKFHDTLSLLSLIVIAGAQPGFLQQYFLIEIASLLWKIHSRYTELRYSITHKY